MMVLVHNSPATLAAHWRPNLGVLSSPRRFYTNLGAWPWAADNDAFSAWDEDRFRVMLDGIAGLPGCLFVTAPDVVGDWEDTFDRFELWQPVLAHLGLPIAYVIQNDQPAEWVPWDKIQALFVGGDDQWKMGEPARRLVLEAGERGLWAHMGRVNGHRRVRYAKAIGCDSFDGTSLSWFRDTYLDVFVEHAAAGTQLIFESTHGKPAPDYNPRVDYPERYSDGPY